MKKETKQLTAGNVFSWIFGVGLLLLGLVSISKAPLMALVFIPCSLFIIPVTCRYFEEKTNSKLSGGFKILIFIVAIFMGPLISSSYENLSADVDRELAKNQVTTTSQVQQRQQELSPNGGGLVLQQYGNAVIDRRVQSGEILIHMNKIINDYGSNAVHKDVALRLLREDYNKLLRIKELPPPPKGWEEIDSHVSSAISFRLKAIEYAMRYVQEDKDYYLINVAEYVQKSTKEINTATYLVEEKNSQ